MSQEPLTDGVTVTFNGVDLTKWLRISDVARNLGQNRQSQLVPIGRSPGKRFDYSKVSESTITIKGDANYDLVTMRRELASVLMTSEPQKLVISDEPDKYYMGIVEGQVLLTEEQFHAEATIVFTVPSGVTYSENISTASLNDSGQIAIDNRGSCSTWPVITATMKGENGLVGLVNDKGGVLQFGDAEEVDTVTKQKSEHALRIGYDSEPSDVVYNNVATSYPYYNGDTSKPNKQQGSFGYGIDPAAGSGAIPTFVNGSSGYWCGPSAYLPIKSNSAGKNTGNFIMKTRFYFATSKDQQGRLEIVLQSGNDMAFSCVIRDSSRSVDQLIVEFWVKGQNILQKSLDRKKFSNGMFRELKITKEGAKVTFQLAAVTDIKSGNTSVIRDAVIKNWTLSDANIAIDGFGFWCMRWQDTHHVIMDVTDTQFDWVNVPYIVDIPNYYQAGDVVTVDTGQRKVYVNGVLDNNLQRVGNDWDSFKLLPGLNIIEPVASSWAEMYDCTVTYREAWL
ncbi:MAG TPA: phage tail family protein [Lapidilactobacillus dextrinicus]|uniref:Phage tail family protein n=1 Tax=Lapidilactobacillus dextrinicus TaxID=51664 RepID=A0A921B1Y6_9LACO|nr:phage tail family protein [Lapidilactobacillus dextrinicus]